MGLLEQTVSSRALGNSKSLAGGWGRAGSAALGLLAHPAPAAWSCCPSAARSLASPTGWDLPALRGFLVCELRALPALWTCACPSPASPGQFALLTSGAVLSIPWDPRSPAGRSSQLCRPSPRRPYQGTSSAGLWGPAPATRLAFEQPRHTMGELPWAGAGGNPPMQAGAVPSLGTQVTAW